MKKMATVLSMACLALGMTLAQGARAEFPEKPINLYVGFSAGGSTDMLARALEKGVEEYLDGEVLVVNKPGAGGAVAAALVAKSKPDGYTLQITPDTPLTRAPHLRKLAFDPMQDFTFISRVAVWKNAFAVLSDSPFQSWDEMVQWAKEHPGELTYGVPGPGTSPDIVMAVIAKREGFTYRSVPFKGDSPNISALLGGHIMVAGGGLGAMAKYVEAGKFRLLMKEDGVEGYPDVPTYQEVGYDLRSPTTAIVFGPAGIPQDVAQKLSAAFEAGVRSKPFATVIDTMELKQIGKPMTVEELDAYVRDAYQLYKGYVEEAGLGKK